MFKTMTLALAGLGLTLAACGGGKVEELADEAAGRADASDIPIAGAVTDAAEAVEDAPEVEPPADKLALADIQLELITLENQCFDTAGALITVEPDLYVPGGQVEGTWTLIYEITGGGAFETYSMELSGDRYSKNEHHISTDACVPGGLEATPIRLLER